MSSMAPNLTAAALRENTDILYEVKENVAWVTINRPRYSNAFRG
jgi:1,4-dihydroxy-2-naphthoyl-CoA synthase